MSIQDKLNQIEITTRDLKMKLYATLKMKGVDVTENMTLNQLITKVNDITAGGNIDCVELEEVFDNILQGHDVVKIIENKFELIEVTEREEVQDEENSIIQT